MRSGSVLENYPLVLNGKRLPYHYMMVDIAPLPLLRWLKEQTLYPKVYWKSREANREHAAVGSLLTLSEVPTLGDETPEHVRFYGGRQFDSQSPSIEWNPFPSCAFWLPQFEIVQEGERTYLVIHDLSEEPHSGLMQQLHFEPLAPLPALPPLVARSDFPLLDQWELQLARALFEIEEGHFEKVVLARKTQLLSHGKLDPFHVLEHLKEKALKATLFGLQIAPDVGFIGATPELLYQRKGSVLYTDALAGTRARGATEEDNLRIQEELLTNSKERREFLLVKDAIQQMLFPLCSSLHWEPYDRVMPTTHVQHIYNRLHATLKPEITDAQLLHTLHPTPALGGLPRAAAMEFLHAQESFSRGWYGAPIGWISAQEAEIAVAIRSALIREKELSVFAGTGIVRGSLALKEWEELEHKITPFKRIFPWRI